MGSRFDELVSQITQIGLEHHAQTLLENTRRNAASVHRTIRDVRPVRNSRSLVVSAGPSLYRQEILARLARVERRPIVVATDGAYIQCLKAGIVPDWVVTIDPHPTRIAVLFGADSQDDYFDRTRADHGFERAQSNRPLVDEHRAPLVIASSAPQSVVERTARFDRYWFVPLVDDPEDAGLTSAMVEATGAPALNTGGTVGTAAWAFAHAVLKSPDIAVVGMDFGYPQGTPLENTQEWNLTGGDPELYPQFPERGYYSSPTYWWYRQNFLDLLEAADARVTNCSGAGLLYGDRIEEMRLEEWINKSAL